MGPFPTLVTFTAEPISGTIGAPQSSDTRINSHEHIVFGADCDSVKGVYRGIVQGWSGPKGPADNVRIPDRSLRSNKWRSLPFVSMQSQGFGHHCVNHTFKWRKSRNRQHITLLVGMEGRVGFLAADWRNFIKPYKYTYEDLVSEKATFSLTPSN